MPGSVYSIRDYFVAAQIQYKAIERADGARIQRRDRGITRLEWAYFLQEARRKIGALAHEQNDRFLPRQQEVIEYPNEEFVELDPPRGVLKHVPYAVTLLEWQSSGVWFPMEHLQDWERWRFAYLGGFAVTQFPNVAPAYNLEGPRLRVLPQQQCNLRVTYMATAPKVLVSDLPNEDGEGGNDAPDEYLPPSIQHAVPVWAVVLASTGDGSMKGRPELAQLWQSAQDDIARACRARESSAPDYPLMTRMGVNR